MTKPKSYILFYFKPEGRLAVQATENLAITEAEIHASNRERAGWSAKGGIPDPEAAGEQTVLTQIILLGVELTKPSEMALFRHLIQGKKAEAAEDSTVRDKLEKALMAAFKEGAEALVDQPNIDISEIELIWYGVNQGMKGGGKNTLETWLETPLTELMKKAWTKGREFTQDHPDFDLNRL